MKQQDAVPTIAHYDAHDVALNDRKVTRYLNHVLAIMARGSAAALLLMYSDCEAPADPALLPAPAGRPAAC